MFVEWLTAAEVLVIDGNGATETCGELCIIVEYVEVTDGLQDGAVLPIMLVGKAEKPAGKTGIFDRSRGLFKLQVMVLFSVTAGEKIGMLVDCLVITSTLDIVGNASFDTSLSLSNFKFLYRLSLFSSE